GAQASRARHLQRYWLQYMYAGQRVVRQHRQGSIAGQRALRTTIGARISGSEAARSVFSD
ncbi:hypothetical protein, partial [Xanthomonas perforans]|uniref:hypothetical protein n=1 Tax=Xanthomonas perforans TaxID=442694 RepID=UPI001F45417E